MKEGGWLPYKSKIREWIFYKIISLYGYELCYNRNEDILFLVKKDKEE